MKTLLTEHEGDEEWLKALRLLYVEDEEGIRLQLQQFLKRRVKDIVTACNGQEGLALFKEYKPDIVMTDLLMPVMNGLDMTEAILKINPRTPVIITTAFNETDYLLRAINLRVEAYLIKPISTEQLLLILGKCARNLSFERAYRKGNRLLRLILSSLDEAVFIINGETRQLTYCNETAVALFGYTLQEMIGHPAKMLHVDPDLFDSTFDLNILKPCTDFGNYQCQGRMLRKNGEIFHCEHVVRPIIDPSAQDPLYLVSVVRDITLQKRNESILLEHQARLNFLANHDPLTGLSNRRLFQDRLNHAMAKTRRLRASLAVFFVDLDSFKPVNDRFGHELGDELLRLVAQRLLLNVREQDTLGRLGGDEFVLLVDHAVNESTAIQVAEKLIRALIEPFEINEYRIQIGASIGISLYPSSASNIVEDVDSLIHRADQAMYSAKQQGGNCFCFNNGDAEKFTNSYH